MENYERFGDHTIYYGSKRMSHFNHFNQNTVYKRKGGIWRKIKGSVLNEFKVPMGQSNEDV